MADGLSEADQDLLADATAAVFVLVAGSDGGIDKREHNRFDSMLQSADTGGDGVLPAILKRAGERAGEAVAELQGAEAEALLERAGRLAASALSPEDCQRYKLGLVHMAEAIAGASGGGLLGLRNPVDKTEQAAIFRLRELIDFRDH